MSDTNVGEGMVPCRKNCQCNECLIKRLIASVAELEKDQARLDWLDTQVHNETTWDGVASHDPELIGVSWTLSAQSLEDVRHVIDSRMANSEVGK